MNLEEILDNTNIHLTDKISYYPCKGNKPHVEYPNFVKTYTKGKETIFVACQDRSYKQIAENVYESITGYKRDLFETHQTNRRTLYKFCVKEDYERYQK